MTMVGTETTDLVQAFLAAKRVAGCSTRTLANYGYWLEKFAGCAGPSPDSLAVHRFMTTLQEAGLSVSSRHTALRTLRAFYRWARRAGLVEQDPTATVELRLPKTLPHVPTDEELRAVLRACPDTFTGRRNRALLLVMADTGLRASEVLNLLVEDWNPMERSLFVRRGKGSKDRTVFASPTTARALRDYLSMRRSLAREDFLFTDESNRPLKRRHLVAILYRLSARAGLPPNRRIHPHSLRHFAATSWLRHGMTLEETRRLLGHETLSTTLRYSSLVGADLQRAHRRVGAVERALLD